MSFLDPGRVADILVPPVEGAAGFHDDPSGFVLEMFRWPAGQGPLDYQKQVMDRLVRSRRVAVRGPHGLGKTAENAWLVLWFALTRDVAGEDWKVITTASAWRQLEKYLWPEIHKWARRLNWERLGRPPFEPTELMTLTLRLGCGEAFAAACENPAKIEGAHADELLFLFDEAKTIPARTFDAAEGAFSGGGAAGGQQAFALASSTPGEPAGRFYEIHKRTAGLEDWDVVHVTLEDTILAGRNSREWAEQRKRQWGADSAVYINRVEGNFAASEADGVIPLSWVEAAIERFDGLPPQSIDVDPLSVVGVDVARSGKDKTIAALRYGNAIRSIREFPRQDTMQTAGMLLGILDANHHPAHSLRAIVDVIGIGAGVVDRLRETSQAEIVAFHASEKTDRKDRSGELSFLNARAAAWWNMRELLDPANDEQIALPPDDELIGDLTAPTWRIGSTGKIQIEDKDSLRARLGRSTDRGDAVVQAFWFDGGVSASLKRFAEDDSLSFWGSRRVPPSMWTRFDIAS